MKLGTKGEFNFVKFNKHNFKNENECILICLHELKECIFGHFTTHPKPCLAHPCQFRSDVVYVYSKHSAVNWHVSLFVHQECGEIQKFGRPHPWLLSMRINKRSRARRDQDPPSRTRLLSARLDSLWPSFSQRGQRGALVGGHESEEGRRPRPKINRGPEWVNNKLGRRRGLGRG